MNTLWPRSRHLRNPRLLRRAVAIVDAAANVFAERGYHGTSTQAIADVLGLRQASLYYYFPSKEAALALVCERGVDGFVETAEAILAGAGTPPSLPHTWRPMPASATTLRSLSTSAAIFPMPAATASAARAGASNAVLKR
jgi:AcrR family transcriptional regulator